MSKEKQIEEMMNFLYNPYLIPIYGDCEDVVNALYDAGYRKQSEGEWMPSDVLPDDGDGVWTRYTCSRCKHFTEAYYRDVRDTSKFCPNCGAKMKGGE